ncbi:MAG: putative O-glycosylation ligase, exosortase A system-associated [Hydrogenophaga sp.]|uniref:putative O-glycosylation ligase, exosortase A system-associated n=1 Tax=Hydrogenophaga sp. TaxID=1904254 RepID=UPI002608CB73|nr:putative O-glycosylation ligase, exosortase A system-associated [Hydrogenophaga sp.]MCW5668918.1 putative O-glycosylation ligase, exosortase A system-associated [Hydrogenophaga sp.]
MRDIALTLFVIGVFPYAMRHLWAAVLLWTWLSIMNPHRLTYGFAYSLPFAQAAVAAAVIALIINRHRLQVRWEPPIVFLIVFVVWMCVTTAFAYNVPGSWEQLVKIIKIQTMTLVAFAALRERKHIELFLWVNALSIGFFGFKGGIFTITSGGVARVWGPGGFIGGNNEIGLAIVMTIPLLNYLRTVATRKWLRLGLLVTMMLCATAALGTQSRGAFLAIFAMMTVLWFRSKGKFVSAIGIAIFATILLGFMPETWWDRMNTIQNYEQDGSAMGRINAWIMAFNLANDHVFGGGFLIYTPAIFAMYAPDPLDIHAAHSIYFQVLGEHGWIGLFLYLGVFISALAIAGNIRKESAKRAETQWLFHLAGMCQVSLVGFAVGGAFLSLAYFDLPYNIVVVLVVAQRWLRDKQWENETQGAFGSLDPHSEIRKEVKKRIPRWS